MISGRVRALNLTVPLGSGRVGSDDLGYGPGSGFSFEPGQTSTWNQPSSLGNSREKSSWQFNGNSKGKRQTHPGAINKSNQQN